MKKKPKEIGRIRFPGNPWPKGHAITAFEWTARVERATGIWFDLHLETGTYNEGSPALDEDLLPDEQAKSDWESRIAWQNFYSCTISSTYWQGEGYGFLAGSKSEPLDLRRLPRKQFAFDDDPESLDLPRPFGIYLLGHDAVSAHRIRFKQEPRKPTYAVTWTGKIALEYAGETDFEYQFEAKVAGVRFAGIQFPAGVSNQGAIALASPFLSDAHTSWKPRKTKDGVRLVPN